jgi:hypothetical protein
MKPISSCFNGGHLDDAALVAIWTSAMATGTAADGRDAHIASCAECRVRYDALASWMQEIRTEACLEADEHFTSERLAGQQAAILRRIETSGRPARVLAFPRLSAGRAVRSIPVRRWIAAAAAAGLLVGVGLGQLMDFRRDVRLFPTLQPPPSQIAQSRPKPVPVSPSITNEETLLQELEAASTPHYEALRAYDTLTPRAADFLISSR